MIRALLVLKIGPHNVSPSNKQEEADRSVY